MEQKRYPLGATAAFGLEGVVAGELKRLGFADAKGFHGGASFQGTLTDAFLANLHLRCADRVLLYLGRFEARSFDELFEGVKALSFEELLPKNALVHVTAKCARSRLMSVPDVQSISKKAIVERMKRVHSMGWLPEDGPRYGVDVHIHEDRVAVTLDTSGQGLSRRGYRTFNAEAPLRETLAAAMVTNGPWRPWLPFFDPMCGSGTLCIEAAMVALDRAPGLLRPFDMERWDVCDQAACKALRQEARERFEAKKAEGKPEIFGSDVDTRVLNLSLAHLRQAGLAGLVQFRCQALDQAQNPFPDAERPGVVCTNPPYGERLLDVQAAEALYRQLAGLMQRLPGWGLQAISSHKDFEKVFGRRADKKRRVYNGRIECEIFNFYPPRPGK